MALPDTEQADLDATNLMTEEIAKAQLALQAVHELINMISVGDDEGEMSPQDHTDAVLEIHNARRAVRHLARIVDGHADHLESLTGAAEVRA